MSHMRDPRGGHTGRAWLTRAGSLSILLIEGDHLLSALLCDALTGRGFTVSCVSSIAEGLTAIKAQDPHCVIVDLDSVCPVQCRDFYAYCSRERPWVGLVALESLTRQQGAEASCYASRTVHLAKSQVVDVEQVVLAIDRSICCEGPPREAVVDANTLRTLTPDQAEVIQLIARGWTNDDIARHRGTSLRAAESLVQRTFRNLGLRKATSGNLRVEASNLWRAGAVAVKASRHGRLAVD